MEIWTSAQTETMPVTLTPYATILKGRTAAGARMDIKAMGFYVKVNIYRVLFQLEYKVVSTLFK